MIKIVFTDQGISEFKMTGKKNDVFFPHSPLKNHPRRKRNTTTTHLWFQLQQTKMETRREEQQVTEQGGGQANRCSAGTGPEDKK